MKAAGATLASTLNTHRVPRPLPRRGIDANVGNAGAVQEETEFFDGATRDEGIVLVSFATAAIRRSHLNEVSLCRLFLMFFRPGRTHTCVLA